MGINTEKQNLVNMLKTKNSRPQERSLSNITIDSTWHQKHTQNSIAFDMVQSGLE